MKKGFIMMFVCLTIMSFILIFVGNHIYHLGYINESQLGYAGAIIGGSMTLIGVWWTIKEQKLDLKEQQERLDRQRREDLAIQYKPILLLTFSHSLINNFPADNASIIVYLELKNIGRGELTNLSINYSQFNDGFGFMISYDAHKIIVQNNSIYLMINVVKAGKQNEDGSYQLLAINPQEIINLTFSIVFNDAFFNQYIYTYDIKIDYTITIDSKDVNSFKIQDTSTFLEMKNPSQQNQNSPKWTAHILTPKIEYKTK